MNLLDVPSIRSLHHPTAFSKIYVFIHKLK